MAVDVTNVQAKLHMNRSRNIVKVFKLKKIIMHEIEKMNSDANISLSGSDLNNFTQMVKIGRVFKQGNAQNLNYKEIESQNKNIGIWSKVEQRASEAKEIGTEYYPLTNLEQSDIKKEQKALKKALKEFTKNTDKNV